MDYAVPDVIVRQHRGHWQVSLNEEVLPKVNLQQQYAAMARKAGERMVSTCATACRRPSGLSRACKAATTPC